MTELELKGGYGEHGRSCFLLKQENGRSLMFDCGILDTDALPYPNITPDEARQINYLFLSHAHKDHTGAVPYLLQLGFQGVIAASPETIRHIGLRYDKIRELDISPQSGTDFEGFQVITGSSGHCPGSLWFYVCFESGYKFFYSGDFQPDPLVYPVDLPKDLHADVAILDMAHDTILDTAPLLRNRLSGKVREYLARGKRIILPVQAFGRGVEILYLLYKTCAGHKIWLDQNMKVITDRILTGSSVEEDRRRELTDFYPAVKQNSIDNADIVIIGDTHLERPENQALVRALLEKDAVIIGTGRRKDGSFMASMYDEGQAIRLPFPHHSSRKDARFLSESNCFQTVLPFHSNVKEVWNG